MSDVRIQPWPARAAIARMFLIEDPRGRLSGGGFPSQLPFAPQRYFVVYDVPPGHVRGEHAHRRCHQLFVALGGSVTVTADNGVAKEEMVLDRPDAALHVPPMVWTTQSRFTPGAMLLVLASDPYDADDYIRDYDAFLALARGSTA